MTRKLNNEKKKTSLYQLVGQWSRERETETEKEREGDEFTHALTHALAGLAASNSTLPFIRRPTTGVLLLAFAPCKRSSHLPTSAPLLCSARSHIFPRSRARHRQPLKSVEQWDRAFPFPLPVAQSVVHSRIAAGRLAPRVLVMRLVAHGRHIIEGIRPCLKKPPQ